MKQKLLLHSCCAPCSSGVLRELNKEFDITILYFNPNIFPEEEYNKRKNEQLKFIELLKPEMEIGFVEIKPEHNEFLKLVEGFENEPEGGDRCKVCFNYRLGVTAKYAKDNGFDIFTTTLSVSPHKDAKYLNELGSKLEEKYGVQYLISDFKKRNGYLNSINNSKKYGLYRQNYCGCEFSIWDK